MSLPVMKTSYLNEVPASFSGQKESAEQLKKSWDKVQQKLENIFPRVPAALWQELGQAVINKGDYKITPEHDAHIHAYLLSQEFSLVVQKIITDEVGSIPIHASHGCSCCVANPGLQVGIVLSSVNDINYQPLEDDYLKHLESEVEKFKAVGLPV